MGYERCFVPKRLNCLDVVHQSAGWNCLTLSTGSRSCTNGNTAASIAMTASRVSSPNNDAFDEGLKRAHSRVEKAGGGERSR